MRKQKGLTQRIKKKEREWNPGQMFNTCVLIYSFLNITNRHCIGTTTSALKLIIVTNNKKNSLSLFSLPVKFKETICIKTLKKKKKQVTLSINTKFLDKILKRVFTRSKLNFFKKKKKKITQKATNQLAL